MKTVPSTTSDRSNSTSATTTQTYPITMLLDRLIYDNGQSPAQFVMTLGYGDIVQGLEQLEPWLAAGAGPDEFIERIAAAYPAIETELRLAVAATMYINRIAATDCESGIPKLIEEEER